MFCLEFRRHLYINPHDRSLELRQHRAECESCAKWYARQLRLERRLRRALELPVPPGLASRVLLRQEFLESPRRGSRWRRAGALAASCLVGFGVASLLFWARPSTSLDDGVMRHVDDLAYVLEGKTPVGDAAVAALLDHMGADVSGDLGDVRFANLCTIRGRRVAHLVIAGARGPVTVLIMPEEDIRRSILIEDRSRRGRILPYGNGALALVSERPQPLGRIEERVRSTVQWRAAERRTASPSA